MNEHQNGKDHRIVVGLDGSPSSREGLRWAVRQAGLTGGSVEAITAWQSPGLVSPGVPFTEADAGGSDDGSIKLAAQDMARTAVTEARAGSAEVQVTARIGEGAAAHILLEAAQDAGLVVVGSRGHGGIAGTLLGSVGQTLAQHSPCPVLIIRGEK